MRGGQAALTGEVEGRSRGHKGKNPDTPLSGAHPRPVRPAPPALTPSDLRRLGRAAGSGRRSSAPGPARVRRQRSCPRRSVPGARLGWTPLKAQRAVLRLPTEKPAPPAPAARAAPRLTSPVYGRSRTGTLRPSAPPLRALNPEGQVRVSHNPISATCLQEFKSPGQNARVSSVRAQRQVRRAEPAAPPRSAPPLKSSRGEGKGWGPKEPQFHQALPEFLEALAHCLLSTYYVLGAAGHASQSDSGWISALKELRGTGTGSRASLATLSCTCCLF